MKKKMLILLALLVMVTSVWIPGSQGGAVQAASVPVSEDPQHPEASEAASQQKVSSIRTMLDGLTMTLFSAKKRYKGVDVSEWQGSRINWKTTKSKKNVRFAFIRTSYTGLSTGSLNADDHYKTNINKAYAAGVLVGAYHFSQAITVKEAKKEANYMVKKLKPYRSKINMPVVMDLELEGSGGRFDKAFNSGKLTKKKLNAIVTAFQKIIRNAGYTPAIYSNGAVLSKLSVSKIKPVWYAGSSFQSNYEFHQYSWSGYIPGAATHAVDLDYWYTSSLKKYQNFHGKATVKAAAVADTTVRLRWNKVSGATKYVVKRNGTKVATVTGTTFVDSHLTPETAYQYTVTAYKNSLASTASSNTVSVKTGEKAEFTETASQPSYTNTTKSLTLKWKESATASQYEIYRSVSKKGTYTKIGTTAKTSYQVSHLAYGQGYFFKVLPYRSDDAGLLSKDTYAHAAFPYRVKDAQGRKMTSVIINGKKKTYYGASQRASGKVTLWGRTTARLALRKKASKKARMRALLSKKKTVTILSEKTAGGRRWYRVKCKVGKKNRTGYVLADYVK